MKILKETFRKAVLLFMIMTVLCGLVYPLAITGISKLFFSGKATGSIIEADGKKYGSALLGQQFTGEEYLWGRIMNIEIFTDTDGNALLYAAPSNISTASEEFENLVEERVNKIKSADSEADEGEIPVDLVTGSGSGLDPHISYAAAEYQAKRIAKSRNMTVEQVLDIIDNYTTDRFLGIFGEKVVNVLEVNLALDGIIEK